MCTSVLGTSSGVTSDTFYLNYVIDHLWCGLGGFVVFFFSQRAKGN